MADIDSGGWFPYEVDDSSGVTGLPSQCPLQVTSNELPFHTGKRRLSLQIHSFRLNTTPVTQDTQASRIGMKNFMAIDTLLIDIASVVPGMVDDEAGAVTSAKVVDPNVYGVVAEIAARTFANGGTAVGVRRDDVPGRARNWLRSRAIRFESAGRAWVWRIGGGAGLPGLWPYPRSIV